MKFYNCTMFIFPRSYSMRIFTVCFASVHFPIIAFGMVEVLAGQWDWMIFLPLLAATLLGTGAAIIGLHGLLSPVRIATERLRLIQDGKPVDDVPPGGPDLAGDLLDSVSRAARSTATRIERLRGVAGTDALTGMRNRRGFQDAVQPLLRGGVQGTLALLDGDRFKQVNDRLGHAEGDRLLQSMARRINETIGSADVAARWGGDEFLVFFAHLNADEASVVVESIRDAMIRRPDVVLDGQPATFSFGLAALTGAGRTALDAALGAADHALYLRKKARLTPLPSTASTIDDLNLDEAAVPNAAAA